MSVPVPTPPPEDRTPRMARRFAIAMTLAGLLLAALAPDGLEQWIAGLPYSPATEEALTYVRGYQEFARHNGLLRPGAALHQWMTDLRAQHFEPKPEP